ncbi:hypothetical protein CMUST_01375 [Corynebacterium mustelae]|uniref:Uncharacterized protein n=1 Tax=Corynebacterium mustelae TaxID=571915 RepID=A0A0G3GU43_9CORY|nr:hypothetical protein [Corynebacterium mustelae]AKK04624.1 hypothetical protein CMUST_01375 [Corynebacterium mustelae]
MPTHYALRYGAIVTSSHHPSCTLPEAATAFVELLNCGFFVKLDQLQVLSPAELSELIAHVYARDDRRSPIFPGFPAEVVTDEDAQLWLEASDFYADFRFWLPQAEQEFERKHLETITEHSRPRRLNVVVAAVDDLHRLWSMWLSPSRSTCDYFTQVVRVLSASTDVLSLFDTTEFRSQPMFAAALLSLRASGAAVAEVFRVGLGKATGPTDVLRVVLACFSTDPYAAVTLGFSRHYPARTASLPRWARRELIAALGRFQSLADLDEYLRHRRLWRWVLQKVHPYQIPGHELALSGLDVIFGNVVHRNAMTRANTAIATHDVPAALDALSMQPAQLFRELVRIGSICRTDADRKLLVAAIEACGRHLRLKTVIATLNAVRNTAPERLVNVPHAGVYLRKAATHGLQPEVAQLFEAALGRVIVEKLQAVALPEDAAALVPDMRPVPLLQRTSELVPGQALALGNKPSRITARWQNATHSGSIGVVFADANLEFCLGKVGFSTLQSSPLREFIECAPDFVSIHLGETKWDGIVSVIPHARYAIISVTMHNTNNSWAQEGKLIKNDPHAAIRIQARHATGETDTGWLTLNSPAASVLPVVIDLASGEAVWLDSYLRKRMAAFHLGAPEYIDYRSGRVLNLHHGNDHAVPLVRAELARIRSGLTIGELMALWQAAHADAAAAQSVPSAPGTPAAELPADASLEVAQRQLALTYDLLNQL